MYTQRYTIIINLYLNGDRDFGDLVLDRPDLGDERVAFESVDRCDSMRTDFSSAGPLVKCVGAGSSICVCGARVDIEMNCAF